MLFRTHVSHFNHQDGPPQRRYSHIEVVLQSLPVQTFNTERPTKRSPASVNTSGSANIRMASPKTPPKTPAKTAAKTALRALALPQAALHAPQIAAVRTTQSNKWSLFAAATRAFARPTRWATGLAMSMMLSVGVFSAPAIALVQVSIATQLQEVQRGSVDGREFLTLHIGGQKIGPAACRSNILRVDTGSFSDVSRQEQIETVALSAMLTAETVMITVPLDSSQCIDGKPTFTDLYLLPSSP